MSEFKIMNNDEIRDLCIKKDLKIFRLEQHLQQKENIIKEVRKYIEERYQVKGTMVYDSPIYHKDILEILDKGE